MEEGLDKVHARHMKNHRALKAGLAAIGIGYTAQEGHQLPMLNAVRVPDGVDDAQVRSALLNRFNIEIGGGLGAFKGKVWRIGLMGYASRQNNVLLFLSGWSRSWPSKDTRLIPSASVAAANQAFGSVVITQRHGFGESRREY